MRLRLDYDRDADAAYIWINELPYDHGEDLDDDRRVDYSRDGFVIGVELLNVSDGVNLDNLPERPLLGKLLEENRFKVFA